MSQNENVAKKAPSSNTAVRSLITTVLAASAAGLVDYYGVDVTIKEKLLLAIPAAAVLVSDGFLWIFKAFSLEDAQTIKSRRESNKSLKRINRLLETQTDPEIIKDLTDKKRAHINIIAG